MPRRKKLGQSPARAPSGGPDLSNNTGFRQPLDSTMATNSVPSVSVQEQVVQNMQEMFANVDPDVIYIVLSECDFKVENAMDSLLELSVTVEPPPSGSPPVSGFEHTAAVLLNTQQPSQSELPLGPSEPCSSSTKPDLLTEELDLLVDEELNLLTAQQELMQDVHTIEPPSVDPAASSVHTPDGLQHDRSIRIGHPSASSVQQDLQQKLSWEPERPGCQDSIINDQHLVTEVPVEKGSLEFPALGRTSAFQVYKKQDSSHSAPNTTATGQPEHNLGRAGSQLYPTAQWNLDSPVFTPKYASHQQPFFMTPVVAPNSPSWVNCAPANPAPRASIPKSWALPAPPPEVAGSRRLRLEGKVLVLLRGAPGSGKSTLARALREHNPGAVILSTDDFFLHNGHYQFNPNVLGEAHEWNHGRAKEAFRRGAHPIIIDNTNMQGWEMKPYVAQALIHNYKVLFREPDTWWKNKPRELERRSRHNVPVERIRRMLDNYERFVTVHSIMGSAAPERKQCLPVENTGTKPLTSNNTAPDIVGDSEQTKGSKNSNLHLSLPNMSSDGHSAEEDKVDDGIHKSMEKIDSLQTNELGDRTESLDQDSVDSEASVLPVQLGANQQIPDCVVESVMSDGHHGNEIPVAFCDSIKQRERRERPSRKSEFEKKDQSHLLKDMSQSEVTDGEAREDGKTEEQEEQETTRDLNFEGDWPTEKTLEQRAVRKRERQREDVKQDDGQNRDVDTLKVHSGPDFAEFRKLLDLIQTGEVQDDTRSPSCSSPSAEVSFEEDPHCTNPPGSGVESGCLVDIEANTVDVNIDEDKLEISTEDVTNYSHVLKLDSTSAVPLSECSEVSTGLEEEAETHSIVSGEGEGESGIAGQILTSMSNGKENMNSTTRNDSSLSGQACESSHETGVGGMLPKQRHRSGKQCKLALTFPQNFPDPSLEPLQHPNAEGRPVWQDSPTDDPNADSNSDEVPDEQLRCPWVDGGRVTQTEPQDFALLWRLNRPDSSDKLDDVISSLSNGFKVIEGNSSQFVPKTSSVHSSAHVQVPYHVVHEKGTQVEESDFGSFQDRLDSLRILSRHFKLVTFDTLEDLYDKCHQDLEWTTNLLLDSGEKFFKEEEHVEVGRDTNDPRSMFKPEEADVREDCVTEDVMSAESAKEVTIESPSVDTTEVCESKDVGLICSGAEQLQLSEGLDVQSCSHTKLSQEKPGQVDKSESLDVLQRHEYQFDDEAWIGTSGHGTDMDIQSMDEIHRLLQAELDEIETSEKQKNDTHHKEERRSGHMEIRSVEMKLPTEVALQLTELFGPVGVDPDTCSSDEYTVQLDLNLAKLLHQKWKDTIQERQRQAALSFHLLQESKYATPHFTHFEVSAASCSSLLKICELVSYFLDLSHDVKPNTDGWCVPRQPVSLRDIIKEEQALQRNVEKSRQDRADIDKRDGATLLKEDQLFAKFPTIDRHFLQDIFRDHNYSLAQTEIFLHSLLDDAPAKTVVAPVTPRSDHQRATSKEREKIALESKVMEYQDTEEPQYEDFRAEARLQRRRQLENFSKAAEAFKQGRREVASFYAQQGHLHGQSMREANHRAAIQIFEKVNSTLLPQNILDLHGLHVEEALEYLAKVLQDKTKEYEQGLCRPQLSVITGKGNHSQGGVARIRPAVIDYLNNRHYRFTEPNRGLVLVSLK
ncbi:NEDD4-binding protein 2-like isoform X2 [Synchiropus splendidus]|uniref:NEDD4-binding protein 2-like isoform X2 n=1 Tax=Synchiropus splendidus TaxID=270530 RepID=UPI00237D7E54|nr:NEDD4-binding protein 2-like isoform X2 [Synchiropus splendidus]